MSTSSKRTMANTCVASAVIFGAAYSVAKAQMEPPEKPTADRDANAGAQVVSLAVEPVVKDGLIQLDVRWSGQQPDSILVISMDSKAAEMLSRETTFDYAELRGITLFRKLNSPSGEAAVRLKTDDVLKFLGPGRELVGHVRLVNRIDLLIREGDPGIKGGLRVVDEKEIVPGDCTAQSRFLCGPYPIEQFANLSPDIEPSCAGVPGKIHVKPVVHPDGQAALLSFKVRISGRTGE
jgi:hypothetical protein